MSLNEEKPSAPLKPAATVMVVRPAQDYPFEVYMLRRSAKSAFVPDMYVFPGGSLDAIDSNEMSLARVAGLTVDQTGGIFRDTPDVADYGTQISLTEAQIIGLHLAALRELFEEAGVLFAVTSDGTTFEVGADEMTRQRFLDYRQQLHTNQLSFIEILAKEDLRADVSRLTYFSHWITPRSEIRRFDTRFFLAIATHDQEAEADNIETTEGLWISPQEALERYKAKNFGMIYPTITHLERLARYSDLDSLQEYARTKEVLAVSPDLRRRDDGSIDFKLFAEIAERW
jgi:8-oxo-dGTP pyrophosphatase MutT (NUDIX family)